MAKSRNHGHQLDQSAGSRKSFIGVNETLKQKAIRRNLLLMSFRCRPSHGQHLSGLDRAHLLMPNTAGFSQSTIISLGEGTPCIALNSDYKMIKLAITQMPR